MKAIRLVQSAISMAIRANAVVETYLRSRVFQLVPAVANGSALVQAISCGYGM